MPSNGMALCGVCVFDDVNGTHSLCHRIYCSRVTNLPSVEISFRQIVHAPRTHSTMPLLILVIDCLSIRRAIKRVIYMAASRIIHHSPFHYGQAHIRRTDYNFDLNAGTCTNLRVNDVWAILRAPIILTLSFANPFCSLFRAQRRRISFSGAIQFIISSSRETMTMCCKSTQLGWRSNRAQCECDNNAANFTYQFRVCAIDQQRRRIYFFSYWCWCEASICPKCASCTEAPCFITCLCVSASGLANAKYACVVAVITCKYTQTNE